MYRHKSAQFQINIINVSCSCMLASHHQRAVPWVMCLSDLTRCQGGAGLPSVIDAKKDSDQVAMKLQSEWSVNMTPLPISHQQMAVFWCCCWIYLIIHSPIIININHQNTTFNNQHQFSTWINIQKYPIIHKDSIIGYRIDSSHLSLGLYILSILKDSPGNSSEGLPYWCRIRWNRRQLLDKLTKEAEEVSELCQEFRVAVAQVMGVYEGIIHRYSR